MVERQLCKLEVRGSNPLASSFQLARWSRRKTVTPKPWRERIGVASKLGIGQFSKRSELLEIKFITGLWRRKRAGIADNSIRPR